MTTKKLLKNIRPNRATLALLILAGVVALLVAFGMLQQSLINDDATINSFEECVADGRPILETYPEQCVGPDGRHFTKQYDTPTSSGA